MRVGQERQAVGHPTVTEDLYAWVWIEVGECGLQRWDSVWFQQREQKHEHKQKQAQAGDAGGWTALAGLAGLAVEAGHDWHDWGRGQAGGRDLGLGVCLAEDGLTAVVEASARCEWKKKKRGSNRGCETTTRPGHPRHRRPWRTRSHGTLLLLLCLRLLVLLRLHLRLLLLLRLSCDAAS